MKIASLLKCMGLCTAIGLGYTHMQMQIFSLAYRQEGQAHKIRELLEENGDITYAILILKSPKNLGPKMLSKDSDMRFVDSDDIIQMTFQGSHIPGEEMKTSKVNTLRD